VHEPFIDERDAFIAHQLVLLKAQRPEGRSLRLSVPATSRESPGISTIRQPSLPSIPWVAEPKSLPWGTIFGFTVTGLFIFLLAAIGFSGVGLNVLLEAFLFWVIIHGVLAALFVLLAGGHPYSALTCLCVAWMTSLNRCSMPAGSAPMWKPACASPDHRFPEDLRDRVNFRDGKDPALQGGPCRRAGNLGSLLGTVLYFIFVFPVLGIDPGVVIANGIHNMGVWAAGLI